MRQAGYRELYNVHQVKLATLTVYLFFLSILTFQHVSMELACCDMIMQGMARLGLIWQQFAVAAVGVGLVRLLDAAAKFPRLKRFVAMGFFLATSMYPTMPAPACMWCQ